MIIIRQLKQSAYQPIWQAMQTFTNSRDANTPDELWLLEHEPVFTQGQAGKAEHIINPHHIPIVQTDRGGQITFHGPGQLMAYTLLDIKRLGLGTRDLVIKLEQVIIKLLSTYKINAVGKRDAPGVYVNNAKICSIGLRVRHGRSYHGLALNVSMDLTPFSYINPCGFKGMPMTQIKDFVPNITLQEIQHQFSAIFCKVFQYNSDSQAKATELPLLGTVHENL